MGSSRANCAGRRVGDVVKLEIEKDRIAERSQRLQHGWTCGGKQLEANFEPLTLTFKAVHQVQGSGCGRRVQGHDQPAARLFDTF
jgi:hypothetical protein